MIIAKNEQSMQSLSSQFFERSIERKYYALVWGNFDNDEGTIVGHIGRSLKNRKVMTVFQTANLVSTPPHTIKLSNALVMSV